MKDPIRPNPGDIPVTDALSEAEAVAECDKRTKQLKQLGLQREHVVFVAPYGLSWAVYHRKK